MTTRKQYTPEFKAAAVARVEAGEKAVDVQKELGLSNSMVTKWAREFKKRPSSRPKAKGGGKPGKYSPEIRAKALARVRAGESQSAVQRDMKVGKGMVSYWVRHDKGVSAGAVDPNGHRTNGATHNGNGNGAVLDAIVFLKKAKKAIRHAAVARPDGLDDPVYLYALLALKVLQGEMAD